MRSAMVMGEGGVQDISAMNRWFGKERFGVNELLMYAARLHMVLATSCCAQVTTMTARNAESYVLIHGTNLLVGLTELSLEHMNQMLATWL